MAPKRVSCATMGMAERMSLKFWALAKSAVCRRNQPSPASNVRPRLAQARRLSPGGFCLTSSVADKNIVPKALKEPAMFRPRRAPRNKIQAGPSMAYWLTVKLKLPWVLWVSTESACQVTWYLPGAVMCSETESSAGWPGTACGLPVCT